MPHGGAHAHHHHPPHAADCGPADRIGRRFALGVALNLGFVVLEAVYGLLANSLSLLADAGHNLSDVLGLVLAWAATILARRQPTGRRTYGLRKSTIMASLTNAVLLLVVSGALAWEALRRFAAPEPVAATEVMVVAAIGVVINGATALLFAAGRHRDLNIRGAFLHMAADAAISLGVVLSALAIVVTGWLWLDPATSLAIVAVIAIGTWSLLRDSLDLALDAVPAGIDPEAVGAYLGGLCGVTAVHDLHIWAMSTTEAALTVHLVRPGAGTDDAWLADITETLRHRFAIPHATIQVENGDGPEACRLAPSHVV
jgi:cobalt-zinc-cadmium efflux system protein